ncbi:hypothetical protein JXK06_00190 [Patescibacteria group bacterium]|nr:hypothetical protein [Patescibacteria group bacterium]
MKKTKNFFTFSLLAVIFLSHFIIFFPQVIFAQGVTGSDIFTSNCQGICVDANTPKADICKNVNILGAKVPPSITEWGPACTDGSLQCTAGQTQSCCCEVTRSFNPNDYYEVPQAPAPKFNMPELQIPIPGLVFEESDVNCVNNDDGSYSCSVNWISKYVSAIYNYGLTVGGILAALMLMAGGLLWLTSGGDSSRVSKAKGLISGSITGLIILFSAYMILYEVNPELTVLKPIIINSDTGSAAFSSTIVTDGWEWDPGIINQIGDASPELSNFINCMRNNLPNNIGRISSISDNNFIGKLTLCESNCSGCVHSCGSCHYGGGLGTNKSYAIDFGDEENKTTLVKAANICGVYNSGPGFILDEGDHLHMSVPTCPKK